MAKLYHPDATGCSFGGKSYERAADGSFEVPDEAWAYLQNHGFTIDAPSPPAAPPEKPKKGR